MNSNYSLLNESINQFALLLVLIGSVNNVYAQSDKLVFIHLSLSEGFSDFAIRTLHRDQRGFLWVGTYRGLDRYDGARVRAHPARTGQLRSDVVLDIAEEPTRPGSLWIGTRQGGLSHYDSVTDSLLVFEDSQLDTLSITSLSFDTQGYLWIGTAEAGLFNLNQTTGNVEPVVLEDNGVHYPSVDSVLVVYAPPASPGTVWVGTEGGLFEYFPLSRRAERINLPEISGKVTAIEEKEGTLWFGTLSGDLISYHIQSRQFARITLPESLSQSGIITEIESSSAFPDNIWIGTRGKGLLVLNIRSLAFQNYQSNPGNDASLSQNDVITVFEDADEILWVGTASGGLNKALLAKPRFVNNTASRQFSISEPSDPVLTIYQAPSDSNIIWLSRSRQELRRYNRKTKKIEYFPTNQEILGMTILEMHEDFYGNFWLAGTSGLLYQLDRNTGDTRQARINSVPPESQVRQIYESPLQPGLLWLATRRMGVLGYDVLQDSVVQQYTWTKESEKALTSHNIWQVAGSSSSNAVLWIATQGGGLNKLDTITGEIEAWNAEEESVCIPTNDILSINVESDSSLWLGVARNGVVRFNPDRGVCDLYSIENGLAHHDVGSMLLDKRNRIWAVTQNGLSMIDPTQKSVTTFSNADGLQSNIFYYHASHVAANGHFLLGGDKGFNVFKPEEIIPDSISNTVLLTGLSVDGIPYQLERSDTGYKDIKLAYDQRDVEFEFAGLDLRQPHLNRYQVFLEGTDVSPVILGSRSAERYRTIEYGWNTFYLSGTNRDGVWSEADFPLRIFASRPYWSTWWFWLLTSSFFIGLIISAYQYRIHQLKRVEQTRRDIAHDLHDDMGSRLSSLALQIEMAGLKLDPSDETRARLNELAEVERGLVKDLRTIVWLINAEFDTLPKLVERMEQTAIQMLQGRRYTFEKPEDIPPFQLDMTTRKNIFLLYKEALHNAIRHSGAAYVNVELQLDELNTLTLLVEDDGKGFDVASALKGQGFHSMQARADALSGTIHFDSAPGKGTRIDLSIPLVKKTDRFGVSTGWQWIRSKITLS